MNAKGLVVLGSTGSIGRQTLDVVRAFPDRFRVVGLAAGSNVDLLHAQAAEFNPTLLYTPSQDFTRDMLGEAEFASMEEMVCRPDADIVMVGTVGRVGLLPTIRALQEGKRVCLANKEVIIMAGEMVSSLARNGNGALLPVDSEPSAIWQCLQGEDQGHISTTHHHRFRRPLPHPPSTKTSPASPPSRPSITPPGRWADA